MATRRSSATAGAMAVGVALALALLLPGLGSAPFDDPGEGQHAEIAREMRASGNGLVLTLNGVRYLDKPPLLYWLTAAAFSVFGESEWAARLAPVAGAVLAAAATALLGARLLGPGAGVVPAGALLSSALFVAYSRYVRPETLFVAAIQWGFTGLLLGLDAPAATDDAARPPSAFTGHRLAWLITGFAALGLASLAKDPLGLVGPLAVTALALGMAGRLRRAAARVPVMGIVLLLVLGVGWYAVEAAVSPGFLWYTVVDNHLLNALQARHFPDEDVPLTTLEFLAVSL